MGKKAHIICAKCGEGENIGFTYGGRNSADCGTGVNIQCGNCGELTSVEEWNEFNGRKLFGYNCDNPRLSQAFPGIVWFEKDCIPIQIDEDFGDDTGIVLMVVNINQRPLMPSFAIYDSRVFEHKSTKEHFGWNWHGFTHWAYINFPTMNQQLRIKETLEAFKHER
ncbi:hypothetical protein ACQKQC_06575 [Vibrio fortis]|uniref:hypothetical protein n=1 Tax=Vibrio fortis TaxID=212667 RepID=UPI004068FCE5